MVFKKEFLFTPVILLVQLYLLSANTLDATPTCNTIRLGSPALLDEFYDELRMGSLKVEYATFPDGRELPISRMAVSYNAVSFCLGESCEFFLNLPSEEGSETQFLVEAKARLLQQSAFEPIVR